jgi:superfamily II DNA or RNA helicase
MDLFDFATTNSKHSSQSLTPLASIQQAHQPIRSCLVVAATGLGKTVIMGGLANHWPKGRVMMISHRFELNTQAIKSFISICNEDVELEQASFQADRFGLGSRIVVASVQTLNAKRRGHYRMEKFKPNDFGLLMIDEAHRAAAVSYRRVIDHFKQNPHCKIVGVTATPDRSDKVGLGCVFEKVACDLNIRWGVENGWLVAPKQVFVQVDGLDLRSVETRGGDLDPNQLARIVELEENLHAMAKPIVDVAGETKQTIVFTASVAQAHRLAELIRDYHQRKFGACDAKRAVSLDGSMTPQDPRRVQIVKDFKEGSIQYLVNCGVATEGFDAPGTEVIAIGRPTKSRALYTQMVGRGTRPLPGTVETAPDAASRLQAIAGSAKQHCTVLDFIGQAGRHSLICTTDILVGDSEPKEVVERANRLQSQSNFSGDTLEAIRQAKELMAAEEEARRKKLTVGVNYQLVQQSSLYDIATIGEVFCPNYMKKSPPSDKQRNMLLKLGFTTDQIAKLNPRSASKAIDHAINNPKTGFGKWLQKKQKQSGSVK